MSLIPTRFFPRSMFDMDYWMRPSVDLPSTLDVFDPFDELDRMMSRNLMWLNTPDWFSRELQTTLPKVPKKWRVQCDTKGFNPNSIKCQISDDHRKLIVTAREGDETKRGTDNYTLRELKRTYNLPKNAETDKLVSFVTPTGKLVVEIPQKGGEEGQKGKEDLFPRIVEGEKGAKNVQLSLSLPENIDPSKVKVTCKDRDLIVQAEEKSETPDTSSQFYYYRRSTLPENTDFNNLKCTFDKNQLSISAPINVELRSSERSIPIEMKKSIQ